MSFRQDEKPLLTMGPFVGLDTTSDQLFVDPKLAVLAQNFDLNTQFRGFSVVSGRSQYVGSVPAPFIGNIFKFFTAPGAWTYLGLENDGVIQRFTGAGFTNVKTGLNSSAVKSKFIAAQKWAMFTNCLDTPLKIDTSFNVTNWGIVAPAAAPTIVPGSIGDLTPGGSYAYLLTFSNADQESSAGPATSFITLANTPSTGTITYSGTPDVGCVIRLSASASSHVPPKTAEYTLTSSDSLATAVTNLAVAWNTSLENYNISANPSAGVITLTNPSGAAGVYFGTTVNTGAGTLVASPTGISPGTFSGGTVQNSVTLTNIPVSADPQVTTVDIYRIGGSQSQFQFVGSVANGTTSYGDTLADNAITGQNLVQFRDPPKPFNDIVFYQDRVFGLGFSSSDPRTLCDVWYTNYQEPWGFNEADQVLACGENVGSDIIVGGAPLPMMLLVLKRQWAWGLFGTAPSDYVLLPLFPLGCASKETIGEGYGLVFWLSPDGVVYSFDGVAPKNLSDLTSTGSSVKGTLDAMSETDYAAAVGFVAGRTYFLSFPTQEITLAYSLISQSWYALGFTTYSVSYDIAADNEVIADTYPSSAITRWFQANTDLGNPITATYTSGFNDSESPQVTKQYRHAVLYSSSSSGTVDLTISVKGYGGTLVFPTTVTLNGNQTTISLPASLVGQKAQISISTTSSTGVVIDRVVLYGYLKRMLTEHG